MSLSLTVEKAESILDGIFLNEKVDKSLLIKIVNSNELKTTPKKDERKQMTSYMKKCNKNNIVTVEYKKVLHGFGRVYAKKSLSLQSIRKQIRHTLCNDYYMDIDIVNAHPVMLNQLCQKNGLSNKNLNLYVSNRESYLQTIINDCGVSRGDAKILFIRMLYNGCPDTWKREFQINVELPKFVYDFSNELQNITKLISNANPLLNKKIKNKKHDGTILSYVLQEYENRVLEVVYEYLRNNNYIENNIATLCFDGIMLKKCERIKELLIRLNSIVLEKSGFNLAFEEKLFENPLTDIITIEEDFTIDKTELYRFNQIYMNDLETYKHKKLYWEHFCCKIFTPDVCYIFRNGIVNRDIHIYAEEKIKKLAKPIGSKVYNSFGAEIPFVDKWIVDINHLVKDKYDFIPFNKDIENMDDINQYNLFVGYNSKIDTEYNNSIRNKIVKPFLDLGKEICNGDDGYFHFFLQFIAQMIKDPRNKPPICFIVKGRQGTGKNVFLSAIANIIGKEHYITSSKPNDFFGEHAEGFYRKLLVNINEATGKDTFDFEGKLKSFISEDTITINPKNIRPTTVANVARVVITTNKENPIPIDVKSTDRRYVVYKTTDKYLSKVGNFWNNLVNHFKTDKFIAALYDYLMDIEYKNINWVRDRPITKEYINMCRNYIPVEAMFIESLISNISTDNYSEDLEYVRNKYIAYLEKYDFDGYKTTPKKFLMLMNGLDLKSIKIMNKVISFSIKGIRTEMIKRRLILDDINDDLIIEDDNVIDDTPDDYFILD